MKNFSNVSFLQARESSMGVAFKCNWFLGLALSVIKEKNLRFCILCLASFLLPWITVLRPKIITCNYSP